MAGEILQRIPRHRRSRCRVQARRARCRWACSPSARRSTCRAPRSARASPARSSATTSARSARRTATAVRTTCRARSRWRRTRAACSRARRCRATAATRPSPRRTSTSCASTKRASCCWCAAPCRARRTATWSCAPPSRRAPPRRRCAGQEGSQVMQLELLNDQGQATVQGRRAGHGVRARLQRSAGAPGGGGLSRPTRARARAPRRTAATVKHSTKKPWRQKGTGRARAGMTSLAAVARGRSHLPEHAGRELHAQGQQEDVPRRHGVDPVAAGARRPPGGGRFDRASIRRRPSCWRRSSRPWAWTR